MVREAWRASLNRPGVDILNDSAGTTTGSPELAEQEVLRQIVEGTASQTGPAFFRALVEHLAKAMGVCAAMVTEYNPVERRLTALAFWRQGTWIEDFSFEVTGTPCELVVERGRLYHCIDRLADLFPSDTDASMAAIESYMGVPLLDENGHVMGTVGVMDTKPMPERPKTMAVVRIFAARAAAEHRRLRAEKATRDREAKLSRLINSAMDAIIELDTDLRMTGLNPAAEKLLGGSGSELAGRPLAPFLDTGSHSTLRALAEGLRNRPAGEQYRWIPGGLTALRLDGEPVKAEASLSRYEMDRKQHFTLILRNVNDRLEAEARIRSLSNEAAYLREELRSLENFSDIIGQSPALMRVLQAVNQVSSTEATVLILGETGTGKELIARSLHHGSNRRTGPMVRVNCAAIPVNLIESELFGHEKGAFTGATHQRDGRFRLAHGGTIFLDEIGELPLELQSKLLRVLQEGELEPVGSTRTLQVDVRVIAATNRDLKAMVDEGKFREDLYYRLNVFPIELPPLRERAEDIGLIAQAFADRFAKRMGRALDPLSLVQVQRLCAYRWPGNVRELQNVIERAVIVSSGRTINLQQALPVDAPGTAPQDAAAVVADDGVLTAEQLQALEKRNMLRALEQCRWRVSGEQGAAALLGLKPSTLASRMKALGIERASV
jgi:PAS domain S-box-containing protein